MTPGSARCHRSSNPHCSPAGEILKGQLTDLRVLSERLTDTWLDLRHDVRELRAQLAEFAGIRTRQEEQVVVWPRSPHCSPRSSCRRPATSLNSTGRAAVTGSFGWDLLTGVVAALALA